MLGPNCLDPDIGSSFAPAQVWGPGKHTKHWVLYNCGQLLTSLGNTVTGFHLLTFYPGFCIHCRSKTCLWFIIMKVRREDTYLCQI